jgi:hypothetical protein
VWPRACKLARPVVRAGAGFDADRAWRRRRDQGVEPGSRQLGLAQLHSACLTDSVHGEHVLGEIDSCGQNSYGLPLPNALTMRELHFPSWHSLPVSAQRTVRDGEGSFIRWAYTPKRDKNGR